MAFLVVIILWADARGNAQVRMVYFTHLDVPAGLASGRANNYVFTDSKGFVWISSDAGLNRYDGNRILTYRHVPGDTNTIVRQIASQSNIHEDHQGDLWFSGGSAVTRYRRSNDDFANYRLKDSSGEDVVARYKWSYLNRTGDTLLFSAQSELYWLATDDPWSIHLLDSIRLGYKDYMVERNGCYRLVQFRPGGNSMVIRDLKPTLQEQPLSHVATAPHPVFDVVHDGLGDTLWVATSGGVYIYTPSSQTWHTPKCAKTIRNRWVVEIERKDAQLVVGTLNSGIYIIDLTGRKEPERIHYINDGLLVPFTPEISRLHLDERNNLFVSTLDNGVFHGNLGSSKMDVFFDAEEQQPVIDVAFLDDTTQLILYRSKLQVTTPNQSRITELPFAGYEYNEVTFVFATEDRQVFVGTYDRLFVTDDLNAERWRSCHLVPNQPYTFGPGYNDMCELPDGCLLVALNTERPVTVDSQLKGSRWLTPNVYRPRKLATDGKNLLAVATYADTLHLLSYDSTRRFAEPLDYFTDLPPVCDIYFDQIRNTFWLGTMGGLYRLHPATDTSGHTITQVNIAKNRPVVSIAGVKSGRLFLGTTEGIFRFDPNSGALFHFSRSDGIQGYEFANHAAAVSEDDELVFGGFNGANALRDEAWKEIEQTPIVRLTNVSSSGVPVSPAILPALSHTYDNLKFDFMIGEIAEPGAVRYQYELIIAGDTIANEHSNQGSITFRNLDIGRYEMTVRAQNSDGVFTRRPFVASFTILPPWYRTWWAYTLYALAVAGLAFAFFWIRLQGIRRAEKEQLRAARAEALAAETETSVLRLQMNPHFIFNSLNAVNAYILKGDKLKAHEYLVQFADLIRDILERSARPLTRMDLAIDLLRDYLDAERMRVGEKLTYGIEVDEQLDTFTTYLPTMILQPFVENAIWHGISGLPEGGKITLRFSSDDEAGMLRVEIEDNGRGRAATAKKDKRHRSMAMDITKRRLEILNASSALTSLNPAPATAPRARYEIEDLEHPDRSAAGTRVKLYLPRDYPREYESSSD